MRRRLLILAVLLAALAAGIPRSGASFVGASQNAINRFDTAAVFNAVSVTLADPGTAVRGTATLSATAASDRTITSVAFAYAPAGTSSWTTLCSATSAPYTCSWNTAALADGRYDLRATATDAAGYSRSSTVASRMVDNTGPVLSFADPGSPIAGSRTLSATASDAGSGIASVAFEYKPSAGGAWTPICSDATSPYSCSWSTGSLPDGSYDLRATATDVAGNATSSTVTGRVVDNTAPTISLTDPGTPLHGTVTLQSATGDSGGSGVTSVAYEYRAAGSTGGWSSACTAAGSPFSCAWSTAALADALYDVRAIATDGAGLTTTSAAVTSRRVDNTAPVTATMTDPGTPLHGTVTLGGTGTDAGSGMESLRIEYKPSAGTTWSTACTDATPPSPFSCSWDSTAAADGSYDFRSVATDLAGNTRTSTAVTARTLDNTGPASTVTSPGMFRSSTTVSATATDPTGVQSVAIQYSPPGAATWTTICTDTTSPYSCAWNAAALADGAYDLRAVATDTLGNQSTSRTVSASVNNTGPTGTDVQGSNGGVDDRLDAGDALVFSYSAQILPSSILAGWSGSATPIKVRVTNGATVDAMEFYDNANTTALNLLAAGTSLAIGVNQVKQTSLFNATIAESGANITVTIGSMVSGQINNNPKGSSAMVWQTSSSATGMTGKPVLPTTVTESGAPDIDF